MQRHSIGIFVLMCCGKRKFLGFFERFDGAMKLQFVIYKLREKDAKTTCVLRPFFGNLNFIFTFFWPFGLQNRVTVIFLFAITCNSEFGFCCVFCEFY